MPDPAPHALFRSANSQFSTQGVGAALPAGPLDTLGARVRDFFRTADGPQVLLGTLPFDRAQPDCLFQPQAIADIVPQPPLAAVAQHGRWRVTAHPSQAEYGAMVDRALERIASDAGLNKVVLARTLVVETDAALDPRSVAMRLGRDPSITTFVMPVSLDGPARTLVGATPELLLQKKGRAIRSSPLAGSAKREADRSVDREAAEALAASDKNRREHAVVVEAIMDALAPCCAQLTAPDGPALHATASMWHLGTPIEGRLRDDDISCADLLARLHPTPAICGVPRERAQALIRELEPFDRGFYAGAVGWTDASGDGEWHIALRCGEIADRRITLFAGAGIVAGSDPAAEIAETSAKFLALLHALGIDEHGRPLDGVDS
ncbi:isochorismate synthase [Pelagibacterium lacus]|nr:isochorismate synthase [Pelagibacterium lacus]